jgi:selenide, water dikinase
VNDQAIRLTSLAHGGGCGCKLAPSVLRQLIDSNAGARSYRQLLVGTETDDDAAVWRLDDHTCVIATTDFFMPMVDEPYDFGRIAAANALSDVYAMGVSQSSRSPFSACRLARCHPRWSARS